MKPHKELQNPKTIYTVEYEVTSKQYEIIYIPVRANSAQEAKRIANMEIDQDQLEKYLDHDMLGGEITTSEGEVHTRLLDSMGEPCEEDELNYEVVE